MANVFGIKANSALNDIAKKVDTPLGFSWSNHPLMEKIWKDRQGKYYTNFDVSVYKKTGKEYFVDQYAGNDAYDGLTKVTALQKVVTAYDKSDVDIITLCANRVNYNTGFNGTTVNKNITIKSYPGNKAILTNSTSASWSKTAGYSYVYQCTKSNTKAVVDVSRKNSSGDYLSLSSVASIAACDATADTYYTDGTTVYAHMSGNSSPSTYVFVVNDSYTISFNLTGGNIIYLENITIIGGISITGTGMVCAKNCSFLYGKQDDSVYVESSGITTIFQNCVAGYATNDGFSYHTGCKSVEINCIGRNNGDGVDGIDNGSTGHGGCKIIRLNGIYNDNYGPNVADVQDNTESWNIACDARNLVLTTNTDRNFDCQDGLAKMWLDGCKGLGTYFSGNAKAYVRDCQLELLNLTDPATIEKY